MIKLDYKNQSKDGSTFYRFLLNDNIIIWFSLYENKHIYSIGIKSDNLFPVSSVCFYADIDDDKPYHFNGIKIEARSLNCYIEETKRYIEELQLACAIAHEIENFFREKFLQEYVN